MMTDKEKNEMKELDEKIKAAEGNYMPLAYRMQQQSGLEYEVGKDAPEKQTHDAHTDEEMRIKEIIETAKLFGMTEEEYLEKEKRIEDLGKRHRT